MSYTKDEEMIVLYDQLLRAMCSTELADGDTIKALNHRLKSSGISYRVWIMLTDLIEYVNEHGTDEWKKDNE